MRYILSVAGKRLLKRKLGNAITMLQIFVGALVIILSLNSLLYINSEYKKFLDESADKIFTISSQIKNELTESYIISPQQLNQLHEVEKITVSAEVNYNIVTFAGKKHIDETGEEILDQYKVVFAETVSEVMAEKDFIDTIKEMNSDNTVNFRDINYNFLEEYTLYDDKCDYVHVCMLPFNYYWDVSTPSEFAAFNLNIVCGSSNNIEGISLLEQILDENEEYEFSICNDFFEFLQKASSDQNEISKISFFAFLVLSIVFVSIICIFLLLIDERIFEISVRRALGAGCWTIFSEFIIELLFISIIPTLLSALTAYLICKNGFCFINITIPDADFLLSFWVFIGILIADIICLVPIGIKLLRLKPYELLVSEG